MCFFLIHFVHFFTSSWLREVFGEHRSAAILGQSEQHLKLLSNLSDLLECLVHQRAAWFLSQ